MSVAVKKGRTESAYKETEIGFLPNDWLTSSLESISKVTSGKRLPLGKSLTQKATKHPYIRIADMSENGVNINGLMFVPDEVANSIKNYKIYKEDIFISVAGTLGLVGNIPDELDGANLTENANRIHSLKADQKYLIYVLRSPLIQKIIETIQTVGAQPKLALTRIRTFVIPLPKIEEQKEIAQALSDADDLIESLEALIAKKKLIKQGTMEDLLTGKKRLSGFKKPWNIQRLGDVSILKARIGWQGLTTKEYLDTGEYFLVTGTEFLDGQIDWNECFYVESIRYVQDKNIQLNIDDVLVTKDGTIGKVAFISELPKPATLNSGVFVIRPKNNAFVPRFFYYLLRSSVFEKFLAQLSAGSTINHLYQKDFVTFKYELPSEEREQREIAQILTEMDSEICMLEIKLEKARKIKQGMMQDLLTGRVRLV